MNGKPKFEGAPDPDKAGTPGETEKEFYEMPERDPIHNIQALKLEIFKIRAMQDVLHDLARSGAVQLSSTLDEVLRGLASYKSPEPPREKAAESLRIAIEQYSKKPHAPTMGVLFNELTKRHNKLMRELSEKIEPEEKTGEK